MLGINCLHWFARGLKRLFKWSAVGLRRVSAEEEDHLAKTAPSNCNKRAWFG